MKRSIGETLKKYRLETGNSVREISNLLISKGFKASEKTIYSWESGNSHPNPEALLIMCKTYGITDVLNAFGYSTEKECDENAEDFSVDFELSSDEKDHIEKYRKLDKDGKEIVDTVISFEVKRTSKINNAYKRYMAYAKLINEKRQNSSDYKEDELLAAHERTDIEVTPEGVQNDLDIMDNEDLWK